MQNYKRKITYFYQYHNGNVGTTAGFLKLEIRGDKVKIIINIQEPAGLPYKEAALCFYHEAGDHLAALKVDRVESINGVLTYQNRTDWQQLFDTGRDLYTFDGIAVVYNDSHYYIGDFQDRNRKDYELVLKERRQETAKIQNAAMQYPAKERKPDQKRGAGHLMGNGADKETVPAQRETFVREEMSPKREEAVKEGASARREELAGDGIPVQGKDTAEDERPVQKEDAAKAAQSAQGEEAAQEMTSAQAEETDKDITDWEAHTHGGENDIGDNTSPEEGISDDKRDRSEINSSDKGGFKTEFPEAEFPKTELPRTESLNTDMSPIKHSETAGLKESTDGEKGDRISPKGKKNVYEKCEHCPYHKKGMEDFDQENALEKMLAEYPKLPMYGATELFSCVRIHPRDIGRLDMRNWKLGVNSFLTHGFYTYQYLLLGKMRFDDGSEHPILGVPGVFSNREKYLANMFGFEQFIPIKKTGVKTGEFGYWIVEIR